MTHSVFGHQPTQPSPTQQSLSLSLSLHPRFSAPSLSLRRNVSHRAALYSTHTHSRSASAPADQLRARSVPMRQRHLCGRLQAVQWHRRLPGRFGRVAVSGAGRRRFSRRGRTWYNRRPTHNINTGGGAKRMERGRNANVDVHIRRLLVSIIFG